MAVRRHFPHPGETEADFAKRMRSRFQLEAETKQIQALRFWETILAYAAAEGELQAEGNSGEFHDDRIFTECVKNQERAYHQMLHSFMQTTRFFPLRSWGRDKPVCKRCHQRLLLMATRSRAPIPNEECWTLIPIDWKDYTPILCISCDAIDTLNEGFRENREKGRL